jgi:hypothetical protein
MPGATPSMSTRGLVKRYRPTSTMPIMSNKIIGSTSYSNNNNNNNNATPHLDLSYSFGNNMNQTPAPYNSGAGAVSSPKPYAPPRPIPPATTAYPAPPPIPPASSFNAPMSPSTTSSFSNYDQPWKNSLRSTNFDYSSGMPGGGYRPVSSSSSAAAGNKAYSHHEAADFSVKSPGGPKALNIQYNSPIGLYSKDNINEELSKKFGFATPIFILLFLFFIV